MRDTDTEIEGYDKAIANELYEIYLTPGTTTADVFALMAKYVTQVKAEAWDEGFQDGERQSGEGDDGPRFVNPYRDEAQR
jgi:hypothetical protein